MCFGCGGICSCFFSNLFFFKRTRPAASMRPPCLICLSTSSYIDRCCIIPDTCVITGHYVAAVRSGTYITSDIVNKSGGARATARSTERASDRAGDASDRRRRPKAANKLTTERTIDGRAASERTIHGQAVARAGARCTKLTHGNPRKIRNTTRPVV